MQSENPLVADFIKLMNSAAGTLAGMTREAREAARERLREAFGGLDSVSREEFEAARALAAAAREEAATLSTRLAKIEAMMAEGGAALEARLARLAAIEARLDALEASLSHNTPTPNEKR